MLKVKPIITGSEPPFGIDQEMIDDLHNLCDVLHLLKWHAVSELLLKAVCAMRNVLEEYEGRERVRANKGAAG